MRGEGAGDEARAAAEVEEKVMRASVIGEKEGGEESLGVLRAVGGVVGGIVGGIGELSHDSCIG